MIAYLEGGTGEMTWGGWIECDPDAERKRRVEIALENQRIHETFIRSLIPETPDDGTIERIGRVALRAGRRTREGRQRNAVRQLPMTTAA